MEYKLIKYVDSDQNGGLNWEHAIAILNNKQDAERIAIQLNKALSDSSDPARVRVVVRIPRREITVRFSVQTTETNAEDFAEDMISADAVCMYNAEVVGAYWS